MRFPPRQEQANGQPIPSDTRSWGTSAHVGRAVDPEIVAMLVGHETASVLEATQAAAEVRSKVLTMQDKIAELQQMLIEVVVQDGEILGGHEPSKISATEA
jgi:hypothetical protein